MAEIDVTTEVQVLDSVRRQLTIEVAAADVDREFNRSYAELARTAAIPGFRRGKVPKAVLVKRFGDHVSGQVFEQLIRQSLSDAIESQGLNVVGVPRVTTQVAEAGRELRYEAVLEVQPEVVATAYTDICADRRLVEVTDEQVQRTLEAVREQHAQWSPVEDRTTVAEGDTVVVDYEVKQGIKTIARGSQQQVSLGQGAFPPEFDTNVIGHNIGETLSFECEMPPGRFQGASRWQVTLSGILRKDLPSLDDDFAKDLGAYESLDELKTRIRTSLAEDSARKADQAVRNAVLQKLVESHDFELPPSMVDAARKELLEDLKQRWRSAGLPDDQQQSLSAELEADLTKSATEQVKLSLLLRAIATQEALAVSDDELQARIDESVANAGNNADGFRRFYAEPRARDDLRSRLLREKVVAFVLDRAIITTSKDDGSVADATQTG